MAKYKVSSIIMLTAFSLFASVSANADEVPTVSSSQVVVSHRTSDPCTSETVEQGVNRDNFVNIAAPGGRGTEGSEWVDEQVQNLRKNETVTVSVSSVVVSHRTSDPCTAEIVGQGVNRDHFANIVAPRGKEQKDQNGLMKIVKNLIKLRRQFSSPTFLGA